MSQIPDFADTETEDTVIEYNPILGLDGNDSIDRFVDAVVDSDSDGAQQDDFFHKAEKLLLSSVIGYLHYYYADDPDYRTMSHAVSLLRLVRPVEGSSVLDVIMLGTVNDNGVEGYEEWVINRYGGDVITASVSPEYLPVKRFRAFRGMVTPDSVPAVAQSLKAHIASFEKADLDGNTGEAA